MELLLFYLFIALSVSFLCSVMEAVLLTTPMSFISMKESQGNSSAKVFVKLKNNIDRPLSAILSLNTSEAVPPPFKLNTLPADATNVKVLTTPPVVPVKRSPEDLINLSSPE